MKKFEEFLKERVVRKQFPDRARANDLIEESKRKLKNLKRIIEKMGIDDENSNNLVEDSYDVLLGLVRARMFLNGFSASGKGAHEAEVAFARKLGLNEREIYMLDQLRYFRNGILYYGKRFDKEYAEKVLAFLDKVYRILIKI